MKPRSRYAENESVPLEEALLDTLVKNGQPITLQISEHRLVGHIKIDVALDSGELVDMVNITVEGVSVLAKCIPVEMLSYFPRKNLLVHDGRF